jgi:hypothetical protein
MSVGIRALRTLLCIFKMVVLYMVNELGSINTFWSIFDELICIDGQPIQKPEMGYNEAFLKHFCPWLF